MAKRTNLWVASVYALRALARGLRDYATVTVPDGLTGTPLFRDRHAKDLAVAREAMTCRCGVGGRILRILAMLSDPSGSHVHPDGSACDDGTVFVESLKANADRGSEPVTDALREDAVTGNLGDTIAKATTDADSALRAASRDELARLTGGSPFHR